MNGEFNGLRREGGLLRAHTLDSELCVTIIARVIPVVYRCC